MTPHSETAPQTASELAHTITGKPVVIWLQSPRTGAMTVEGQAGFDQPDFANVIANLTANMGESEVIARVMASGQEETVPDIRRDPVFRERDLSQLPNPIAMLVFPISMRGGKTIGILGLFDNAPDQLERLERLDRKNISQAAHMVAAQAEPSYQARCLADATHELVKSSNLNLNDVAGIIARTARELTGASSSAVWLWNAQIRRFTLASHREKDAWTVMPRNDGLARRILGTGQSIKIDDATQDREIREILVKGGKIRSQVGVPIQREQEPIGVLFVNSREFSHFTDSDVHLLETLVGQLSAGLGWVQRLMDPIDDVEESISHMFDFERVFDKLCKEIQEELGFDYVAVQLIQPVEGILETVFGTEQVDWVGVKHPMDVDESLFDIQVDVARSNPPRIEVLHGWDERFDEWIYEHFRHDRYVRVWVPMLLVRDEAGYLETDWWQRANWKEGVQEKSSDGWRFTLELDDACSKGAFPIGTVDAGYKDPEKRITPEQARQLAGMVSEGALDIRQATLPRALKTIAEGARYILRADASSLHFFHRGRGHFAYEVTAGEGKARFYYHNKPGHHHLWEQAIKEQRTRFVPDESRGETDDAVEQLAPKLYQQGIRAIAVFPFEVDDRNGVLYAYFETPYRFTGIGLRWVESFVRRAERAVRDVTNVLHGRDQTRKLANLHGIASALILNPESSTLLRDIAGYVASMLGADIVAIYEYLTDEERFTDAPTMVGKLFNEQRETNVVEKGSIPFRIIGESEPIYAEKAEEHLLLRGNAWDHGESGPDFIAREKIRSAIACPLTVTGGRLGVMFIYYRTHRRFTDDDRNILVPILTLSAVMAIQVIRGHREAKEKLGELKPLRFLNFIAARIQDPRKDLNVVLRLLLAGITADIGLKFSRVMLFLMDEEEAHIRGEMAVGSQSLEEAEQVWDRLRGEIGKSERDLHDWLLDDVERFSRELERGEKEDSPLSQAVRGMPAVSIGQTGALTQCIKQGMSVVIKDNEPDPFRDMLRKNGAFPDNEGAFACVPLIANERTLGAIVVDYQFTRDDWRIDDIALGGLDIYAGVMAMAIRNARLLRDQKKDREATWQYFARQTIHSMGNRISQIEGTVARLRSICKHPTDENKPYLERLEAGIEESKALLVRFRDVLRPAELEREEIDLGELLASVENQSHDTLKMGGVEFSIQISEQPITLMGDRHRLSDAFAELLRNAQKAMEWESIKNPGITIRASREGASKSQVRIEVSNPGQGISRELKQRIFEPFYHGDGKGDSQGLGLATIKKDIEAHQGTIEETGVPGEGACFTICLPCIK
uniref:histidine kinase n=1 Tax=Candidatus Kentrum sp. DK TaxID=2126562 RepID=A0A450SW92_9GAMM|nr:MAG: Signal transduction histidine kinase [Candidatus Kentron sp. DK]